MRTAPAPARPAPPRTLTLRCAEPPPQFAHALSPLIAPRAPSWPPLCPPFPSNQGCSTFAVAIHYPVISLALLFCAYRIRRVAREIRGGSRSAGVCHQRKIRCDIRRSDFLNLVAGRGSGYSKMQQRLVEYCRAPRAIELLAPSRTPPLRHADCNP
jgi:hypothetical protein